MWRPFWIFDHNKLSPTGTFWGLLIYWRVVNYDGCKFNYNHNCDSPSAPYEVSRHWLLALVNCWYLAEWNVSWNQNKQTTCAVLHVCRRRQQELEELHEELEYQLRPLLEKPGTLALVFAVHYSPKDEYWKYSTGQKNVVGAFDYNSTESEPISMKSRKLLARMLRAGRGRFWARSEH